jgi:hypothetical protein
VIYRTLGERLEATLEATTVKTAGVAPIGSDWVGASGRRMRRVLHSPLALAAALDTGHPFEEGAPALGQAAVHLRVTS